MSRISNMAVHSLFIILLYVCSVAGYFIKGSRGKAIEVLLTPTAPDASFLPDQYLQRYPDEESRSYKMNHSKLAGISPEDIATGKADASLHDELQVNDVSNNYDTEDYEYEDYATNEWVSPDTQGEAESKEIQQTQAETSQASVPSLSEEFDEYDEIYKKYYNLLVPGDNTEVDASKYVNALSKAANDLYKTLNENADKTVLWPVRSNTKPSETLKLQFDNLQKLVVAYGTKDTRIYKTSHIVDKIKECLEFLVSSGRYDGERYYGNWWDWQVGVPSKFVDILIIMKKELTIEKLNRYNNIINAYVPDTYQKLYDAHHGSTEIVFSKNVPSKSQVIELARVVLGLGILQKDKTKIHAVLQSIVKVMKPVTKSDGFYEDGSYIDHESVPYIGTYGNELLKKMGDILEITQSTKFAMPFENLESVVECVAQAFLPLIYRGEAIATVRGRDISREPTSISQIGSHIMYTLLTFASYGSAANQKKLKESVKYWMRKNQNYYQTNARTYHELVLTHGLLTDPDIAGDKQPFTGVKMYASMDRFVQHTNNYTLGLSLYSNRISAFGAGSKENKRGWHTADGAMYLYNYDDVQFRNSYWPTIDWYRFPGTTVDTIKLDDELTTWHSSTSSEKWVGGVANEGQAVVGMALNKEGFKINKKPVSMNLKGKKSWFIVEGQIVALGAGITGTTTASIETIVDNRLLNDRYEYEMWSNYGQITEVRKEHSLHWLLLKSSHQLSSIGYYFPEKETVDVISETRNGSYCDINAKCSKIVNKGTYRKIIINHGQRPVDSDYAYVLLPGINMAELKDYAKSKYVSILENSPQIQAVQIVNEGYLGINVWNETGGIVAGISSDKPVSLMRKTNGVQYKYILSDPTQSNNVVSIRVPEFSQLITMSKGIQFNVKKKEFVVDFAKAFGASKEFTVAI